MKKYAEKRANKLRENEKFNASELTKISKGVLFN